MKCKCSRQDQIPEQEVSFIHDQREKVGQKGNMVMQGIDINDVASFNYEQQKLSNAEKRAVKSREEMQRYEKRVEKSWKLCGRSVNLNVWKKCEESVELQD